MNKSSKSASLILAGLLHFTPVAGRLAQAIPALSKSPIIVAMTWIFRIAAVAGAYHTVSAASAALASAKTVNGTQGTRLSYQIRINDGENRTPQSWRIDGHLFAASGSTTRGMPPGLSLNLGTGIISGTPTSGGSFPTTITAYEHVNGAGASLTFTVTFVITATTQPTVITNHPAGRGLHPGETITLTVGASGTAPFTYVWQKNGEPIPGATASTYTSPPVSEASAGNYTAVVTGAGGSATSNPAAITVSPLSIAIISHTASATILRLQTAPGRQYVVEATPTLGPVLWTNSGEVSATTTATEFTETRPEEASRFWRYRPVP